MKRREFITLLGGAAAWPVAARAQQLGCEAIPAGSGRTDCYIGLSRINSQKSDIAASTAQHQTDSAINHQLTGRRSKTKRRRRESLR